MHEGLFSGRIPLKCCPQVSARFCVRKSDWPSRPHLSSSPSRTLSSMLFGVWHYGGCWVRWMMFRPAAKPPFCTRRLAVVASLKPWLQQNAGMISSWSSVSKNRSLGLRKSPNTSPVAEYQSPIVYVRLRSRVFLNLWFGLSHILSWPGR